MTGVRRLGVDGGARGLRVIHGALALIACVCTSASAAEPAWSEFLSRREVGADAWTKAHPEWDGRGVVIAVLDTGLDPSVPGLDKLPTGGPKIIEARDFSGEGHVVMARAEVDGEVLRQGDIVVRGVAAATVKPLRVGDYWLGAFDEAQIRNSAVEDVDHNGRNNDRFAVLAFRRAPDGEEVMIIDTDGDGDLADERVRRSYAAEPQWFTFGAGRDPKKNKAPLAIAATSVLDDKRVELHFDDGSPGSHCAGIAAGFGIEGKTGFDGIAPGARLMSLKIGHGALTGGATTRGSMAEAIAFASRWARDNKTPVVMNVSYGIGSEVEGAGDIQRVLDAELQANRWLSAAVSAGNEGPGLSSVGNPSGTLLGWSAGALVPDAAWDVLLGAAGSKRPKSKKIYAFSSRGGELDKPDGLTPGVAWSTVPPYLSRAVKNGTSMAAPQAAGVMALLISGALAEARPWTPGLLKRALRESAKPIAGYSRLEQGAGVIDVLAAWQVLTRKRDASALAVAGWKVATSVPGRPGTTAPVSYWRVGGYVGEAVSFKVEPRFYGDLGEAEVGRHFETFTLESDVGWLTTRGTVAMRGNAPVEIPVTVDAPRFERSGHYVGRVRAKSNGLTAFELVVVVVVPETFRGEWTRVFNGKLDAGDVGRVLVEVPPGATAMHAHLTVEGYGNVWLVPFTPEGHHVEAFEHRASSEESLVGELALAGAALAPGTWELTLLAPLGNRASSKYALTVAFTALAAPSKVTAETRSDGRFGASLELTNGMHDPFIGRVVAVVDAFERTRTVTGKGERVKSQFALAAEASGVELELAVAADVWDRMSDIAVNVVDARGNLVAQGAFGQRKTALAFDGAPGEYTIEIVGGLVDAKDEREWKIEVVERQRLAAPIAIDATFPTGSAALYPGVPTRIGLQADALRAPPAGYQHRLVVSLIERGGASWAELKLPLN